MAKKQELTEEQIQYIKEYKDKFREIKDFITGVRTLPGVYIGATGNIGWKACIREIFQNAVDESLRAGSPCHYIRLVFDERNQSAFVEDTGSGIPHGQIVKIYTSERMGTNYDKKPGEYTSGAHGMGSGVALALSEHFEITSYVLGKAVHVEFNKGIAWPEGKNGEQTIPCPDGRQGTSVFMVPDNSILGGVNLTCAEILDLIRKIIPMMNIGDRVDFVGIDINGNQSFNEQLINKDGIATGLYMITKTPLISPIVFSADNGTMKADIIFTYDSADMDSFSTVLSYGNFTPTTAGFHVDGFLDGLCRYFRKYMNTFYLAKNSKITVINNDVKTGLKAVVSAAHLHPVFAGQFKGILNNTELKPFIENLTYHAIDEWAKRNPGDLQKVCKYIKDIADIRTKSDDSKIKLSNQYEKNAMSGKPAKYIEPTGHKRLELFIVEGDSALGTTKQSRDPQTQGIFPIRGKLLNAFNKPKSKFLQNPEIAAIIQLVSGGTYGKNLDMNKVIWDKIIFMCDADPDKVALCPA